MEDDFKIVGYWYVDGTHWCWKEKEIAIIDELTNEIEWLVRKISLPSEIIEKVKNARNHKKKEWIVKVVDREDLYALFINDNHILTFDGREPIDDDDLGKFVCAAFWHRFDDIYHYSDKAKDCFYPDWRKNERKDSYSYGGGVSWVWLKKYLNDSNFEGEQFRYLWGAFCFQEGIVFDEVDYKKGLNLLWEEVKEKDIDKWNSFEEFDKYMSEYLKSTTT